MFVSIDINAKLHSCIGTLGILHLQKQQIFRITVQYKIKASQIIKLVAMFLFATL